MSTTSTPALPVQKHFSSSILLWMRTDKPRQAGMDHWQGPHSGIIANTPGLTEYRQLHLEEHNPGRWPAIDGIETAIPEERRVDGVAEVTFKSALSILEGRKQTALAYKDEISVFRRTLLYAGPPNSSRWWNVGTTGASIGSRALIYLRRREGTGSSAFHRVFRKQVVPALAATGTLLELRTQEFLPWSKATWDTSDVAHDNPKGQRFHASIALGFVDDEARDAFFSGRTVAGLSAALAPRTSAIHAYDMRKALRYVRDGKILDVPEQ